MGNTDSHDAGDQEDPLDPFDGIDTLGYRVLGVQPNSPAAVAGLVSFLDFLVGANGKMLLGSGEGLEPGEEYDDIDLPKLLEENKGKELEFLVWNIKSQSARLVPLTPNDTWGGAGLLGVTIRLDNYAGAEDRLVRVLSVEPDSPAAIAGLLPLHDFLLGTTHQTLDSVDRLAHTVLRENIDQVVELYVYNSETDMVRVVALMPTYNWGDGDGLLGAEVGTGYLHRLPAAARATSGISVERKVRYVQEAEGGESSGDNAKRLELEPQLEMEPADDEEEEVRDHRRHTPQKAESLERMESVPLSTPEKPNEDRKSTPEQKRSGRRSGSGDTTPERGLTRRPSSDECEAIFCKPPPAAAEPTEAANTALPPPPKPPHPTQQEGPPPQFQHPYNNAHQQGPPPDQYQQQYSAQTSYSPHHAAPDPQYEQYAPPPDPNYQHPNAQHPSTDHQYQQHSYSQHSAPDSQPQSYYSAPPSEQQRSPYSAPLDSHPGTAYDDRKPPAQTYYSPDQHKQQQQPPKFHVLQNPATSNGTTQSPLGPPPNAQVEHPAAKTTSDASSPLGPPPQVNYTGYGQQRPAAANHGYGSAYGYPPQQQQQPRSPAYHPSTLQRPPNSYDSGT